MKITIKMLSDFRERLNKKVSIVGCLECLKEAKGDTDLAFVLAQARYGVLNEYS